jgi:TRAP-type C4-dicarboxylate transport system permease small subunit
MLQNVSAFLDKVLSFFEEWSLFLVTFGCLIALFMNVVLRYSFNYTLAWSEELVREVIIFTTFIGCSAAIKNRSMIKIDAVVQFFPRLKLPLSIFSSLVTLVFAAIMMVLGWKVVLQQAETRQSTLLLEIPLELLFAIMPLMGFMMFIRTLLVMRDDVRQLRQS